MKREVCLSSEWAGGCLDDYPGGYVVRCDKSGQNFASADIARIRLDGIVAIDRQAVPCWRWVWKNPPPARDADLSYWMAFTEKLGFSKRRYRYEVRR